MMIEEQAYFTIAEGKDKLSRRSLNKYRPITKIMGSCITYNNDTKIMF